MCCSCRTEVGGVIDFYFACNDFFIYDLAIMLNSWCFEIDGSYNITKGQAVIQAYRAAAAAAAKTRSQPCPS